MRPSPIIYDSIHYCLTTTCLRHVSQLDADCPLPRIHFLRYSSDDVVRLLDMCERCERSSEGGTTLPGPEDADPLPKAVARSLAAAVEKRRLKAMKGK